MGRVAGVLITTLGEFQMKHDQTAWPTFLLILLPIISFPAHQVPTCEATGAISAVDSTLVATFLDLPTASLKTRQEQAQQLIDEVDNTQNGRRRRALLKEATDTDPATTLHWLARAETELAMGYTTQAADALASARITINFVRGAERRAAIREYSLAKGWWLFNAGRWRESQKWGQRALKYDAGLVGYTLVNLNSAQIFNQFSDMKTACRVFDPIHSGGNRQANKSWCYLLYFYFHKFPFDEIDVIYWQDRSIHHDKQNAMRWRDFGLYCEVNQAGLSATKYYEKSARSITAREGDWLTRLEWQIPNAAPFMPPMPFWINPDGGYVTGSLLAYLGHVHQQMRVTTEQNIWAEMILTAYGMTIRRCPDAPWSILWRAEALMVLDRLDEARTEIHYARSSFEQRQLVDPNLDRVHGHLLLRQKKYGAADPMIRKAVEAFPEDGTCRTDLGLIEVYMGHTADAYEAFGRALELDAGLAVAWYNRGLLNLKEGHLQAALADVQRATELVPDNERIRNDLARIHQAVATAR